MSRRTDALLARALDAESLQRAAERTAALALAEVARLTVELDDARKHPALAENVRLAHHLEKAEQELAEARAALRLQDARLADLARRYPQAFPGSAA